MMGITIRYGISFSITTSITLINLLFLIMFLLLHLKNHEEQADFAIKASGIILFSILASELFTLGLGQLGVASHQVVSGQANIANSSQGQLTVGSWKESWVGRQESRWAESKSRAAAGGFSLEGAGQVGERSGWQSAGW